MTRREQQISFISCVVGMCAVLLAMCMTYLAVSISDGSLFVMIASWLMSGVLGWYSVVFTCWLVERYIP